MPEKTTDEKTTGGLVGKAVGKAKELAGELTDASLFDDAVERLLGEAEHVGES